jgi:hypothetical protein
MLESPHQHLGVHHSPTWKIGVPMLIERAGHGTNTAGCVDGLLPFAIGAGKEEGN